MYYLFIQFPFSSVNDEDYTLALVLNSANDFTSENKLMREDPGLFTHITTGTSGNDTYYMWEGTLTGGVKAVDDDRENMWTPMVASKLSFTIACRTFPAWLLAYCNNNRAKVVLYKNGLKPYEMWRGYLVDQTLNMTVVNDILACSLVAVDEVGMAKYMNFKESLTYVTTDHWCTIFGLMNHYHALHHRTGLSAAATGFSPIYTILGLSHTNCMLWHRQLCVLDSEGDPLNDLSDTLVVNLDRWLTDEKSTWDDVLTALCEYLGVTFAVGSFSNLIDCDAYLLTCPTDNRTVEQFVHTFDTTDVDTLNTSQYLSMNNPSKVGANLQITTEPDRYKEVKVMSEPERFKGHEYLTPQHYKDIDSSKSIRYLWGTTDDDQNGPFITFGYHKMKYIEPDDKEDDYLEIPACQNGEGYQMARDGELPYDDLASCDNIDHPTAAVADSLDFITFKEGACCVRIGGGPIGGLDEDNRLTRYFLIMNHMWGNMWGNYRAHVMQSAHIADTVWLTLKPLGNVLAIHPSDKHYIRIAMSLRFIRENMGRGTSNTGAGTYLYKPSPGVGYAMGQINFTQPAILLPCEDSEYTKFEDGTANPNGHINAWNSLVFPAYIHIGNLYFNGSAWVYVNTGETKPICWVTMWNGTTTVEEVDEYGFRTIETANYYYTVSNPYLGNNSITRNEQPKMLVDLDQLSSHSQPLEGRLEVQVLGQFRFISTVGGVGNSIPFVLINGIDINYSDDSEILGEDISNTDTMVMDQNSHTKEVMEKTVTMATPRVDGFFSNALLFDNGKAWQNLKLVKYQSQLPLLFQPEWDYAERLYVQYGSGQMFVELETPITYETNVRNVCFSVSGLTEASGYFLPVKREFDYVKETMKVKLMRHNVAAVD